MMIFKTGISALLSVGMIFSTQAVADDFSFTGSLATDDEVLLFDFTVAAPSIITLRTYSYAGGVLASGTVVPPGGFDPILALFDSAGNLIDSNDDGISGTVPVDPNTVEAFDTNLEVVLDAGDYTVSVTQYNNRPIGPTLADGFDKTGQPSFTSRFNCSNGQFCDASNSPPFNNRTSDWSFDVLNVEEAILVGAEPEPDPDPVPEPEPEPGHSPVPGHEPLPEPGPGHTPSTDHEPVAGHATEPVPEHESVSENGQNCDGSNNLTNRECRRVARCSQLTQHLNRYNRSEDDDRYRRHLRRYHHYCQDGSGETDRQYSRYRQSRSEGHQRLQRRYRYSR